MTTKNQCPQRICRSGLWFIVRSRCHGLTHIDSINGDRKVWFTDCLGCAGEAEGSDILQEIVDERVSRQLF